MSQVVYTELEALPLRWPYLQLEPLDASTTHTWQTDQTFNTPTSSTTYTPADVGSPVEVAVYGPRKLGQVLLKKASASYELATNFELSVRKVGSPGPLKMEVYTVEGSSTVFVNSEDEDRFASTGDTASISSTSWVAHTRSIGEKIRLTAIRVYFGSNVTWTVEVRTAQSDGSPSSTILQTLDAPNNQWVSLNPVLELDPGLYSIVVKLLTGTGTARRVSTITGAFGTSHSNWRTIDSGSTWSSASQHWNISLKATTLRYEPGNKLGEYMIPSSVFGTTTTWTTLYHNEDLRRLLQSQDVYVVFSSPDSPNASNCYMIQRGGSGRLYGTNYLENENRREISYFTDGSTDEYHYADVLVRKTYNEYARAGSIFDKTYYLGQGSYGPECRIRVKATSGTVYALPAVILDGVFTIPSEKSTTSTSYTSLTWDVTGASGVPEIKTSKIGPVAFLVRGDGAYNRVEFTPRIYYDRNPVTPKDFGFTELYLMRLRADASNTLVRVNDRTNIYFASSGDTVAVDPNFRAPVKKLHVITGRATADLLGVL